MLTTMKTDQHRRAPEPGPRLREQPSSLHEFPAEWWTVLHATQPHAKLAPAGRNNGAQALDIEVAPDVGREAGTVPSATNPGSEAAEPRVIQPGAGFER